MKRRKQQINDYPISVSYQMGLGFCFDFERVGDRNSGGRNDSVGAMLMAYHSNLVIKG